MSPGHSGAVGPIMRQVSSGLHSSGGDGDSPMTRAVRAALESPPQPTNQPLGAAQLGPHNPVAASRPSDVLLNVIPQR